MFKIIHTKPKHICCAYRCGEKRGTKSRFCPKHKHRFNKANNPLGYVYSMLKSNAKRRGKQFDLTLEQFKTFCAETDYLKKRGKTGKSASIDRIDNTKGYSLDNIQVLSLGDNSRKGSYEDCPF